MTEPLRHVDDELLWDASQAAAFLGWPVSRVRAATRREELPHRKVGRLRFYSEAALRRWAEGYDGEDGDPRRGLGQPSAASDSAG